VFTQSGRLGFNDEMKRKELLRRLNQIPDVEIPEKVITMKTGRMLATDADS